MIHVQGLAGCQKLYKFQTIKPKIYAKSFGKSKIDDSDSVINLASVAAATVTNCTPSGSQTSGCQVPAAIFVPGAYLTKISSPSFTFLQRKVELKKGQ